MGCESSHIASRQLSNQIAAQKIPTAKDLACREMFRVLLCSIPSINATIYLQLYVWFHLSLILPRIRNYIYYKVSDEL